MKSPLISFLEMQSQKEAIERRLGEMREDSAFQKAFLFKERLDELLEEFGFTSADVVKMLSPDTSTRIGSGRVRKKRKLKIYTNPHNGEVVETRGGNHNVLKAWRDEFGRDEVESWAVDAD